MSVTFLLRLACTSPPNQRGEHTEKGREGKEAIAFCKQASLTIKLHVLYLMAQTQFVSIFFFLVKVEQSVLAVSLCLLADCLIIVDTHTHTHTHYRRGGKTQQ